MEKRRAIVFDVDNTLTAPRSPIGSTVAEALRRLTEPFYLAAGSNLVIIESQVVVPLYQRHGFRGTLDMFLSNGPSRYRTAFDEGSPDRFSIAPVSEFLLSEHLGLERLERLKTALQGLLESDACRMPDSIQIGGNRLIDRGPMINLTPMGRTQGEVPEAELRSRDAFVDFDKRTGFRLGLLPQIGEILSEVHEDLMVTLGGQTSFDIVVRGYDKSFAVRTLLDEGYSSLVYIGDALHEHGNDAAITKFIDDWTGPDTCPAQAICVDGWQHTLEVLNDLGVIGDDVSGAPEPDR